MNSVDKQVLAMCAQKGEAWPDVSHAWRKSKLLSPLIGQLLTRVHRDAAALSALVQTCQRAASELALPSVALMQFAAASSPNRAAHTLAALRDAHVLAHEPAAAAFCDGLAHIAEVRAANGAAAFERGVLVVRAMIDATLLVAGVDPVLAAVPIRQTAGATWLGWLRRAAPTLP